MPRNTSFTLAKANSTDSAHFANGYITALTATTAADWVEFDVGFTPSYVCVENITDRIKLEWYEGMAADTCIKTAATGARTLETTNQGITVTNRSFRVSQNATLAAVVTGKTLAYSAHD